MSIYNYRRTRQAVVKVILVVVNIDLFEPVLV